MTTRYYEERECEHGEMRGHRDSIPGKGGVGPICPGGQRRELTGVEARWCDEHNAPEWRDGKCYTVVVIEVGGSARFNTCRIVTRFVLEEPADG